jgi:UDP-N-acetylmuramate dehydrogenase
VTIALRELTTMRLGGPTRDFVAATETDQLVELVRDADAHRVPVLLLGGGSNLVVGDRGWDGLTVKIASSGVEIDDATVRADAGVDWDSLVRQTLAAGLAGLEQLSGVPGTVGGTPVQNVGAYGALTSDVLESVTVYDRQTGEIAEWDNARCEFGRHRHSAFKYTDRYLVLRVTYRLRRSRQSGPLQFADLVRLLDVEPGGSADPQDVRQAVLRLRAQRGSLLDPDDHDTWSVGSFFLHPIVPEVPAQAADCPAYPDPLGIKLPAGWLIEHAGFPKGYGLDWGRGSVALSSKHALAVTNRGNASTAEVMAFAGHIRAGVEDRFGIRLRPECRLVNCSLDDSVAAVQPS